MYYYNLSSYGRKKGKERFLGIAVLAQTMQLFVW